ncbi:MAG: hypothetical protein HQL54_00310 [Magnetococcales bacterium]|nr:hypothetical protein [Magnetococcales bacterium]
MINALPATPSFGVTNVVQDQANQSKAAQDIRTQNAERLVEQSVRNAQAGDGASHARAENPTREETRRRGLDDKSRNASREALRKDVKNRAKKTQEETSSFLLNVASRRTADQDSPKGYKPIDLHV